MCKPPFHLHPQNSLHSWPGQLLPTRPLPFESSFSLEAFPRNQRWGSTPLCFKSEGVEPLWFMSPLLVLSTSSTTALATLTLSVHLIVWLLQQTFLQKYWETQWRSGVSSKRPHSSQSTEFPSRHQQDAQGPCRVYHTSADPRQGIAWPGRSSISAPRGFMSFSSTQMPPWEEWVEREKDLDRDLRFLNWTNLSEKNYF